jgi:hypothetical protein
LVAPGKASFQLILRPQPRLAQVKPARRHSLLVAETPGSHLLPSGLYRRLQTFTGSTVKAGRGLERVIGITRFTAGRELERALLLLTLPRRCDYSVWPSITHLPLLSIEPRFEMSASTSLDFLLIPLYHTCRAFHIASLSSKKPAQLRPVCRTKTTRKRSNVKGFLLRCGHTGCTRSCAVACRGKERISSGCWVSTADWWPSWSD